MKLPWHRARSIVAGQVNATGTLSAGYGFTCWKQSTGVYVVKLQDGLKPMAVVANSSGFAYCSSIVVTDNTFRVDTYNASAAVADLAFQFVAVCHG